MDKLKTWIKEKKEEILSKKTDEQPEELLVKTRKTLLIGALLLIVAVISFIVYGATLGFLVLIFSLIFLVNGIELLVVTYFGLYQHIHGSILTREVGSKKENFYTSLHRQRKIVFRDMDTDKVYSAYVGKTNEDLQEGSEFEAYIPKTGYEGRDGSEVVTKFYLMKTTGREMYYVVDD